MKQTKKAKGNGTSLISTGKTINAAGGLAFDLKDREKLVTGILTSFVKEPKYYGDNTDNIVTLARKMTATDPEFVAKAACYARNEFHMRSISHMLAAEVAKGAKGNKIVRRMVKKVVERADDITNILSYYFKAFGKRKKDLSKKNIVVSDNPVSRSLRRGIADVFPRFDEYSLAKYKGEEDEVKLRDALLIARPKPTDENQAKLWKKLIEGKLETPKTRETILSDKGQSKETWHEIIDGKVGYMMLLRNLKNMLENKIDDQHLDKVCSILKDPYQVRNSKQLPFRYFSAYREVEKLSSTRVQQVLEAIEIALELSFENLPFLMGNTAIIVDESGSMSSPLSSNGSVRLMDIGNLLAAASIRFCERSITIPFGATAKHLQLSRRSGIFDNMKRMENSGVGHSTILTEAFKIINTIGEKIDRIIIFSDMQAYGDSVYGRNDCQEWTSNYRKTVPNLWIHSIDLAGYGTTKVIGDKVNLIAGWSEKVFDYISQVEEGGSNIVKAIEEYQI